MSQDIPDHDVSDRDVSDLDASSRPSDRAPAQASASPAFDHPPRPLAQRLGAILWPSFFAAGVSTMVCFALLDPLTLRDMTFPHLDIDRETGYAIGFFAFWLATAASSLFTWILLRPASRFNRALKSED
jgi:hypothetical protein